MEYNKFEVFELTLLQNLYRTQGVNCSLVFSSKNTPHLLNRLNLSMNKKETFEKFLEYIYFDLNPIVVSDEEWAQLANQFGYTDELNQFEVLDDSKIILVSEEEFAQINLLKLIFSDSHKALSFIRKKMKGSVLYNSLFSDKSFVDISIQMFVNIWIGDISMEIDN